MLHAMIMAGGGGTRFWPRSRVRRPKQFLSFSGDRTLLHATLDRIEAQVPLERCWVITSAAHRDEALQQLPNVPATQIVGEPMGRDTAACIGLGAALIARRDPDATIVVMPADHAIEPVQEFRKRAYGRPYAETLARRGFVVAVIDAFYFGSRRIEVEKLDPAQVPPRLRDYVAPVSRHKPWSADWIAAVNRACSEYEHLTAKTLFSAGFTWPGIHVWDDRRVVDYLSGRPDVDAARIGARPAIHGRYSRAGGRRKRKTPAAGIPARGARLTG